MISKLLSHAAIAAVGAFILTGHSLGLHAQTLTGSGSTFINPAMTKWVDEYKKATGISVNYQSVGSGAGINNLIDGTTDFGGSDAPMNADERGRAKGPVIHLPVVIGAVCIAYNIEEFRDLAERGLELSPVHEILIEESVIGWKEFELEVMRDVADNFVVI